MTKEIKKVLAHMLQISERMLSKDSPILSAVVGAIHKWMMSIDLKHIRGLSPKDKNKYEWEMVQKLHDAIEVNEDESGNTKN